MVLKMCLTVRASLARMHYSEANARLRLIYRLRISASRIHREREGLRRMTARWRHSFALPSRFAVSTFWFSAALNLPSDVVARDISDKAISKSA